ncbi:MAG TPA: hypothetical protein VJQ46_15720 [Gemmatimonadales bacterium]|nr:hypothetical protein [Gemmatimonadales bacterium]
MNKVVRRRLEMFKRVRGFSHAQPSADANYAVVLDQLDQGIIRLEVLAQQQVDGLQASRASVVHRQVTRRRLHREFLPHLVTVAEAASVEEPALAEVRMPKSNVSNEVYRTLARNLLEQGKAHRDVLMKHGLAEKLLDDLTAAVDTFDATLAESNEGRREHVGARAELDAVSDQVMRLVERLDGLNRYRFGGNAELKAAWDSARRVVQGPRTGEAPETGPSPAGDVRPAA